MKTMQIISKIFFPERCDFCREIIPFTKLYCDCQGKEEIRIGDDVCLSCGKEKVKCSCPFPQSVNLEKFAAVYSYEGLIKVKLHRFKFRKEKSLCNFFGTAMSERVATVFASYDFDVVTFVPSDKETEKIRGYNQSRLLAETVAEKFFIPWEEILIKREGVAKQHKLSAEERLTNLKGKIALKKNCDVKGKTILLCDDIKTTGATLGECRSVLLKSGAKEVCCITAAVTPFNIEGN